MKLTSILILLIFASTLFPSTSHAQFSKAYDDISSYVDEIRNQKYYNAIDLLKIEQKKNPGDSKIYFHLGSCHAALSEWPRAEFFFYAASMLEPDNPYFLYNYGLAFLYKNDAYRAMELFSKLKDTISLEGEDGVQNPESAEKFSFDMDYVLGAGHYHRNDFEISLEHLQSFLERKPENYDALYMVCDILLKRNNEGDLDAAKEVFSKIEKLDTDNEEITILNARRYLNESKYKRVLKIMRHFIRAGNGVTDNSHLFLASVYYEKQKYSHAVKSIKDALAIARDPRMYHMILPWLYYKAERVGEVKRGIDKYYALYGYSDKVFLLDLLIMLNRKLTAGVKSLIESHANPGWHQIPHSPQLPFLNPYLQDK